MILETKISYFPSTRGTECVRDDNATVGLFLERIRNGTYKEYVDQVRSGNEEAKRQLPTVAMHGIFDGFRKKDLFVEASGLIILDIDNIEDDLQEVKEDIMDSNESVLACMVSPSGNGIKVLYYITPEIINANNYNQIGKQLVSNFEIYGDVDYLSVTDCLIMTYDPDILINENASPSFIAVKEVIKQGGELEPLDEKKILWDDAEDFFLTVLENDIANKTANNYHFIQVSLLDLAKFGFRHPEHDLSFVVHSAEENFKYSPDNQKRFIEAAQLASTYPQIKWPYKLFNELEEEEEQIDYSEYQIPEESISKDDVAENKDNPEDNENFGLPNYNSMLQEVKEKIAEGDRVGAEISLKNFANIFRFKGTGLLTVTGIPTSGKTEWIDQCLVDLARLYDEESIIVGFEQEIAEHLIKLMRKIVGADIRCDTWMSDSKNDIVLESAYDYIISKIMHIDTNKVGGNIIDILKVLAREIQKKRESGKNMRYVVIDPFNMLSIKGKLSGHEKVEEILRRLTHFSHQMGVMVILVAHPFKMKRDEKTQKYMVPDFYSVKGSSAFFEMSYHGLVVHRNDDNTVLVRVLKVKQNNLGEKDAEAFFLYDKPSGRYIPIDENGCELDGDHFENDWLEKVLNNITNNDK